MTKNDKDRGLDLDTAHPTMMNSTNPGTGSNINILDLEPRIEHIFEEKKSQFVTY